MIKRAQLVGVLAFSLGYVTRLLGAQVSGECQNGCCMRPSLAYFIMMQVACGAVFRRESGVDINLEAVFSPHASNC